MSLLYVCDGCDARVLSRGTPPPGWISYNQLAGAQGQFTVDACAKPECRQKVRAMDRAPEVVLPF